MSRGITWNPWREFEAARREASALLAGGPRWSPGLADGPAFNVHAGENGVVLTAELPGFEAEAFDISARNDTVVVRGKRQEEEVAEGARYHARERSAVEFEKSFRLPFPVDAEKTEAAYEKRVLTISLHRPAKEQPRKIGVRTA